MGWNWAALAMTCALAVVHLVGGHPRVVRAWERSRALSIASGVTVAYVFVHLLPDLADEQRVWVLARGGARLEWLDQQVYIAALVGLLIADGLGRLGRRGSHQTVLVGIREAVMAIYNILIGYYAVRLRHPLAALMGTIAFGAHFMVDDHELDETFGWLHRRHGRRVLAGAVVLGWLLGSTVRIRATVLVAAFSLVAGAILLHSLRDELSVRSESQFGAFVAGALVYSGLLVAMFYAIRR